MDNGALSNKQSKLASPPHSIACFIEVKEIDPEEKSEKMY